MRTIVVGIALVALSSCSSAPQETEPEGPVVPRGFDLPAGVTLTEPGTTLEPGEPASVVLDLGNGAASAVTVEVTKVEEGSMKDFRFFSLDEPAKRSTPYYVDVAVRNEGPAGLGGTALPVLAHSDANVVYPASELVGRFAPCRRPTVPTKFLPDAEAELCLIYLIPRGEKLETVDLQADADAEPVRWTP